MKIDPDGVRRITCGEGTPGSVPQTIRFAISRTIVTASTVPTRPAASSARAIVGTSLPIVCRNATSGPDGWRAERLDYFQRVKKMRGCSGRNPETDERTRVRGVTKLHS